MTNILVQEAESVVAASRKAVEEVGIIIVISLSRQTRYDNGNSALRL